MQKVYDIYFEKKANKVISAIRIFISAIIQALLIFIVGSLIFGAKYYVVIGYSMEPEIPILSVAMDMPQSEYKVGDVITFIASENSTMRNTHRIISKVYNADGTLAYYITHGDNPNIETKVEKVDPTLIDGKVVFFIPTVGEWFMAIKENIVIAMMTLIAIYAVINYFNARKNFGVY